MVRARSKTTPVRTLVLPIVALATLLATTPTMALGAATPDEMVADFVSAYQQRNFELYDATLHDDFLFEFAPEDAALPEIPASLDRAQELAIAFRQFSGQPSMGIDGPIPPITGIDLLLTPLETQWTPADGELQGTVFRTYRANMVVRFAGGFLLVVRGDQRLYAQAVDVPAAGAEAAVVYQLRAWQEFGISVAASTPRERTRSTSEDATWGQFKMGYFSAAVPVSSASLGTVKAVYGNTP
jgi:hypothetical protein